MIQILGMRATEAQKEILRHELGLDKPVVVQYFSWIGGILHGDFGQSIIYHEDVGRLLLQRFPLTAYYSFLALVLSSITGIFLGVISAVKRGTLVDSLISLFANTAVAIPTFWLGIVGIYIVGLKLGWLPIEGWTSPFEDITRHIQQLIMPLFTMTVPSIAITVRQTRSAMLETIRQDYIRTAKSKGLRERVILYKHALRNALIPVITLIGLGLAFLLAGQVLVETVFNIPGVGRLLVRAALDKDYLIVQAGVLVIGTAVCLVNLLVDIAYGWVDPRIRYK
ncbi:MAG: ABC transporter permease [Dehalococcoidales bacterium]|nr:ABC transporter permease [Dehalococcoidales bacterium]